MTDWPAAAERLPRQLVLGEPVAGDAQVEPFSLPEGVNTRGEAFALALQHLAIRSRSLRTGICAPFPRLSFWTPGRTRRRRS